ncbi:hypothetical protein B842_03355 [Corynebacterium humireducens NBRC 106098 = DSM 45392]|uniref:Major capsid protein n=1 Tax=Corynebacterium humireducens NBRC 106098 = DSM 45392 TaxID=1223515 RepID=A0A0B5D9Z9_9CORY|nr:major capsid protein [Corynebacterium humireducens]AJE32524.1 hypothetical protein B842_03355 [Corynebacterium humireducens NBRC 106098 = DSM 45392]
MPFEFPDTLPTDADALADLRAKAVEAFNDVYDTDKAPTEEELAHMQRLVEGINTIDTALSDQAAADERATSAADMAAALAEKATPDSDDTSGDDTQNDSVDTPTLDTPEEATPGEPSDEEEAQESVAASGSRTRFSAAAGSTKTDLPKQEHGFRLTTSAKNYETGVVDTLRVAEEFGNLAQGRAARVIGAGGRSVTTVAYLDRNAPAEFTVSDESDALAVLEKITDESRLDGGSLVAAGGWCAPSETIYDFLPVEAPTGLLSLPELTIRRGGIRFPKEPDFDKLYDDIGFHQTEAQAQANTEKNCIEIPCGEFEEIRLDVEGVCITSGILQDKAWPEQTKKFVDEALRLHQHKVSARRIKTVVDGSTVVGTLTGPMFGTAGAVLSALELQVADMRTRHRIPRTRSVEGIAPEWLLSVLRADLAYRDEVLPAQVTDEQIKAHFRNLGANLQFVVDWQNDVIGAKTPAVAWPTEVQVVLYPAGTWWSATEPVINLGIIHDSTLIKQNRQVQMFTEDGVAVGKRGPESRLVTIPVAVNGEVGARYTAAVAP